MNERDQTIQQDQGQDSSASAGRGTDDRRQEVNPADSPVPSSPAPDEDSVREGKEKLDRVKPY